MKKPAGRKKTASPIKSGPKKGAAGNTPPDNPKSAGAGKETKAKRVEAPKPAGTKEKRSTKASAKPARKTKRPSVPKKRTGKDLSKAAGMATPAVETASGSSAPATTTRKTAPKTRPKKTVKKPARGTAPAAKRLVKRAAPVAPGRTIRPGVVKISKVLVRRELPEEYGENEVILMPVDPNVLFVDWEIKEEEVPAEDTAITMRVFGSATARTTQDLVSREFLEVVLNGRTGSGFFDIGMPGRDVMIEIGFDRNGTFLPILRSGEVPMPEVMEFDELGIAQKLFESGVPAGY